MKGEGRIVSHFREVSETYLTFSAVCSALLKVTGKISDLNHISEKSPTIVCAKYTSAVKILQEDHVAFRAP